MNITIYNNFKYNLASQYKVFLKNRFNRILQKYNYSGINKQGSELFIKDEKKPNNSKSKFFNVTFRFYSPKKNKEIIVSKRNRRLKTAVDDVLKSLDILLSRKGNKKNKIKRKKQFQLKRQLAFQFNAPLNEEERDAA